MTPRGRATATGQAGDTQVLHVSEGTRVTRLSPPDRPGTVIRKEFLGPHADARYRQESALLDRLAGVPGIPALLDRDPATATLLLEDGGTPLREAVARRDPLRLVRVAGRLADVLAGVHRAGVVHRDVNPSNIVIRDLDGEPLLIDLDHATTFAEERPAFSHERQVVGTLAYLAPEQSGRTGRPVDQRADLYALGASLYELATGAPPFGGPGLDPLDLLHAHLAVAPRPPAELAPELPAGLSQIILRLLEKEADRRYQSAEGLRHDLTQLEAALTAGGTGAAFPLGRRDFPSRFAAPSRLVGRDAEIEILRDTYRLVCEGGVRGLFVAGAPGVGKTSLLDELRPLVTASGGLFVTGKFDQYRRDVDAVAQTLHALGGLLLAEPAEALATLKERLLAALGPNVGLVTRYPEFAALLELPAGDLPEERTEIGARLRRMLCDVLRCVASPQRPVVLVLDDLQWATPFAIGGLDAVLTAEDLSGVLVVGAYRHTEVDTAHPLTGALSRWERLRVAPAAVRLENLPPENLTSLLADLLRMDPAAARDLAAAVGDWTAGNPYDTLELVNALRRDGSLQLDEGGWRWNAAGLRRAGVDHGVVGLLHARIDALAPGTVEALQVAACLGGEVDLDLLAGGLGTDVDRLEPLLGPALEDGLLVPVRQSRHGVDLTTGVRFRHDRVQQAAFSTLAEAGRRELHLRLGRRLAGRPGHGGLAAEQYQHVWDRLTDPAERRRVARLFLDVAEPCRLTDPDNADRLLRAGTDLVRDTGPDDADLRLALSVAEHATLSTLGRLDEADRVYTQIRATVSDPVPLAAPTQAQMANLVTRGRHREALDLGLDLLARMGVVVPDRDAVRAETLRGWSQLRAWAGTEPDDDLHRAQVSDPRLRAVVSVLQRATMVGYWCDKEVMAWLVVQAQRFWVRHGPCPGLADALCFAGFTAGTLDEDYATGYAALRRVLAVCEAREYAHAASQARFFLSLTSAHWFEPLEDVLAHAREAHEGLLRTGDLFHASFGANVTMPLLLDLAGTLADLESEIAAERSIADRTGNAQSTGILLAMRQFVRAMRGTTDGPGSLSDASFDEAGQLAALANNPPGRTTFHLARGLSAMIFADSTQLAEHAREAYRLTAPVAGTYRTALARVLRSVALADAVRGGAAHDDLLAELDTHRAWLAARAADAPSNFGHLLGWTDAERAWAVRDRWAALAAFDTALTSVRELNRAWQAALVTERAGRCHLDLGLEQSGRLLLQHAYEGYLDWGATGKAAHLHAEYPFLRAAHGTPDALVPAPVVDLAGGGSVAVSTDVVDLLAVVKASQALSRETSLERLAERVVAVLTTMTGATGVRMVLRNEESGDWRLRDLTDPDSRFLITVEDAADRGLIPLTPFRYAERTRQPLGVADATRDTRFCRDPYLAGLDRCALLLVPVLSHGKLRAMLVLENRLQRGAFSPDRLDAVTLIAGQLAVSLDNAIAERFRSLVQRSGDLTVVCDDIGTIFYASAAARDVLGTEETDLVGRALTDLAHPQDRAAVAERLGQPDPAASALQCRLLHADGDPRWIELSLTDLTDDPVVGGIMVHLRDVTERHRLETELQHAQKLESIGQLSAGIAHEINTPIQFISNNLQFLSDAFTEISGLLRADAPAAVGPAGAPAPDGATAPAGPADDVDLDYLLEEVPEAISQTLDGTRRVATIVRAMKAFGHPGSETKSPGDLNEAVRNTVTVATGDIRSVADVDLDLDEDLPLVNCHLGDVNQVLLNLVVNAAHAMTPQAEAGRRGTLTVRTRTEGDDVLIQVQDTGTGIPAEIAERVFDQFFTTKPVGQGTGQGLALAHTLIHDRHQGTLTFDSTPGEGTTFTVRLPATPS